LRVRNIPNRKQNQLLRSSTHNNTDLQTDWNEHGESNFVFTLLATYEDEEESVSAEQALIDATRGLSYNIANATMGGDTFTHNPRKEEIREIKRRQSTGENNPMYGKPKSELTIRRIKEANSKPVWVEGVRYSSITEAARTFGIKVNTAAFRVNSKSERFTRWRYAE